MENSGVLQNMGRQALVVTGRGGSSRRNGSLEDICTALDKCHIKWELFDKVEPNPSVTTVMEGAQQAQISKADFIVGVGGGSPLDAAKAIAILAKNEITVDQLFAGHFEKVLPVVAVPTTAGTGSEVTPYSILTYSKIQNKKSIRSPYIIPAVAFLDPEYTFNIPMDTTVDTAIDAFSHAYEGFLSVNSNPISDLMALEALRLIGPELLLMARQVQPDQGNRQVLLYASLLAGMVISHTGTSVPHAMGYSFTYFKDVPHGRANGLIIPAFSRFILDKCPNSKMNLAWQAAGFTSLKDMADLLWSLTGTPAELTPEDERVFVNIASQAKNLANSPAIPDKADLAQILAITMNRQI